MAGVRAQANPFVFTLITFWNYFTGHRLFPIFYVFFVLITVTPCSINVYQALPANQHAVWGILCTGTTIVCDLLEMCILSTILITDANTARSVSLYYSLPFMTLFKIVGKIAKTECKFTMVGELAGELMGESWL